MGRSERGGGGGEWEKKGVGEKEGRVGGEGRVWGEAGEREGRVRGEAIMKLIIPLLSVADYSLMHLHNSNNNFCTYSTLMGNGTG